MLCIFSQSTDFSGNLAPQPSTLHRLLAEGLSWLQLLHTCERFNQNQCTVLSISNSRIRKTNNQSEKKKNQHVQSSEINMQCDIETAHSLLVTSCMQMIPIIHEQ